MNTKTVNLILALFLILVVVFAVILLLNPGYKKTDVCFNAPKGNPEARCIIADIADKPDTQAKGLTIKESLKEDEGMLFVFPKADKLSFWMKDMKFPIDIIWVNESYAIVDISRNLPPCMKSNCPIYEPKNNSMYVIEVQANFTERYNITNKTPVFFKLPK